MIIAIAIIVLSLGMIGLAFSHAYLARTLRVVTETLANRIDVVERIQTMDDIERWRGSE